METLRLCSSVRSVLVSVVAALACLSPVALAAGGQRDYGPGWPRWRGPNADAVSQESITVWPPEKLWEFELGSGVSSVIAYRGRVYGMGHRDGQDHVYCLDADTGKVIWQHSYRAKSDQTSDVRFPGPRSTPATDGRAVYTLSLDGQVHCLDAATGKPLWYKSKAQTGASDSQQYGVCAPVLLHENMLVVDVAVQCIAYDKTSGRELWRTSGSGGWNGAAPVAARFGQRLCIVHGTGRCLDAATGRQLWSVPYGEMSVATPVVVGDKVFLAPFHGRNYGGAECAVVQSDGTSVSVVWKNEEVQGLCLTAVHYQGYLYAPDRDDLSLAGESGQKMNIKCIDFQTGQVRWVQRPIPWPNCIIAGGKLLIQTLSGELILADASPEAYREHGRAKLLAGRFWTVPALADGRLFCRNNNGRLVAFRVGGAPVDPNKEAASTARGAPSAAVPVAPIPAASAAPTAPPAAQTNWPRFRGVDGSGIALPGQYPSQFDGRTGKNIVWKTTVPLPGYSSPVVWENQVFLTGADSRTREVYCFDAKTGRMLWRRQIAMQADVGPAGPEKPWHAASYAASTPVANGKHLCAMFANGDVACLATDGTIRWVRKLGLPENHYGHAASPVIWDDLLLIQLDQATAEAGRSKILALSLESGKTVWETGRPVGAGWSTPLVIDVDGKPQLVACGNPLLAAYNPRTGQLLWQADTMRGGYYAVPSPIFAGGLVVAGTEGAVMAAVRPDGKGDVARSKVLWTVEEDLPSVCSPLSDGELLFLLTSDGLLSCHELHTGKRLWQKDFSGGERSFDASPSLVGKTVYLIDSTGGVWLVPATRHEPKSIAQCHLGEPCLGASPAFSAGRIYFRGEKHLICAGQQPEAPDQQ